MVSLFLLLGCNLSYIVDLFAGLRELASASARTLLKLASSVRALLKPYGDTLTWFLNIAWLTPTACVRLLRHKHANERVVERVDIQVHKRFPSMLDEKTKCSFCCETSTVTYVIYIIISMSTEITKKKIGRNLWLLFWQLKWILQGET